LVLLFCCIQMLQRLRCERERDHNALSSQQV